MVTSILHEIKKFLNNPEQITLEFTFLDFESSVYKGIRTVKNLSAKRTHFTVVLVKNKTLGSISFFFRDGPTYQFALTLEEANLYNDNNSYEYLINKFIVWGNDAIQGSQLKINSNYIIIYASIHDGNPRGLDSLGFNQIYSNCISVESYNYAFEIETLKKPVYKEPNKNSSNVPPVIPTSPPAKDLAFRNFIIFVIISVIVGFFIYGKNNKSTTNDIEIDTSTSNTDSLSNIENSNTEKSLKGEFKSQNFNNRDLPLNDINNVAKLNGFKTIKLGSDISIYNFENYHKNNAFLTDDYSKIHNYFDEGDVIVGEGFVANTKLEYINNKLVHIELFHFEKIQNSYDLNIQNFVPDYRGHSLVNLYTKIFGKPTKLMLFDNDINFNYPTKECLQEDYESCFSEFCNLSGRLEFMQSIAVSFIWKADSVIYELIILSSQVSRSDKKENDKKKESFEKGIPYYSSERSLIRIYNSEKDLLQKLKSLEQKSFDIEFEQEEDSKAKSNLNDI